MTTHVLVAIDDSEQSSKALDHTFTRFQGEKITVLHVVDPMAGVYSDVEGGYYSPDTYEQDMEAGEQLCESARERAEEAGILESTEFETAVEVGRPAREILTYVEENGIDHVVMGSHGRTGVSRVVFGSVAEKVTRRAPVPVTIVR